MGDEVLLICGAVCKQASSSFILEYTWKEYDGGTLLKTLTQTTNEVEVEINRSESIKYTCEINSECGNPQPYTITFTALG